MALVTIGIPTVNRLHYLREAVSSALAQTFENIEIIISADGPNEEIEAWSQDICRRDSRVRYQQSPTRLGLAGNWNALADAAKGEFLIIMGDDDRLLPSFVKELVKIIPSFAQVAFANHYLINDSGVRLEEASQRATIRYHRHKLPSGEVINPAASVWRNSIPMSAAMLRTHVVQRLRFKEDLNTPEIEFFARLAQEGGRFFFTSQYLSEYRTHDDSATVAGLRGEALVKYLERIEVSAEVEPYKREFMESLLVNSVARCFKQGNTELARQFLANPYYPRFQLKRPKQALTGCAQHLCAQLPSSLGYPVYRLLRNTKSHLTGAP